MSIENKKTNVYYKTMKPKLKSIFSILALVLLSFAFLFTLLANLTLLLIPNTNISNSYQDSSKLLDLESEKWSLQKQLEYKDSICLIQSKLPNESSQPIYITVNKYDEEIPITTDINPYPESTKVSEIGVVTDSTPIGVQAETKKIRLYRIELLSDPNIYIEYISHKDTPFLYILKDSNSSEFLLYPIIKNNIVPIDTTYYIIDSSTLEN